MNSNVCIFLFFILKISCVLALEVDVVEVTTSTVKLFWSGRFENVEYSYVKAGTEDELINTTTSKEIEIQNLEVGEPYSVTLRNGLDVWQSQVTLATCPDGWLGQENACYLLNDETVSWSDAYTACSNTPSAYLANPSEMSDLMFLRNTKADLLLYWFGVNDMNNDGRFTYSDNSTVQPDQWLTWKKYGASETERNLPENGTCLAFCLSGPSCHIPLWSDYACFLKFLYVCEYEVPDSPKEVDVFVDSHSANITWERPKSNQATSDSYNMIISSQYEDSRHLDISESPGRIEQLSPGNLYSVTIATRRDVKERAATSGGIYPATYFITKPLPPINLEVGKITPTTAVLLWKWPSGMHNNTYNGFLITYHSINPTMNMSVSEFVNRDSISVDHGIKSIKLARLEPFTQFYVDVFAVSKYTAGSQKLSAVSDGAGSLIFQTPVSPPQTFQLIQSSLSTTSFSVSWDEAEGYVDQYFVSIASDEIGLIDTFTMNNTSHQVIMENLVPGEEYQVKIKSVRNNSESEALMMHQRTRPLPVSKRQISFFAASTTANITIYPLHEAVTVLDGYNLTLQGDGSFEFIDWRINADGDGWVEDVIRGLTPGRTYKLSVYATSGHVRSTPVQISRPIITELVPPDNFRSKHRNETSLVLTWDPVVGDFADYLVSCSSEVSKCPNKLVSIKRDDGEEVSISGLYPGASYNFAVQAQNERRSSKQTLLSIRTLPSPPTDLRTEFRSDTAIEISWYSPEFLYSGYHVAYTPTMRGICVGDLPVNGSFNVELEDDEQQRQQRRSALITSLIPGVDYDFTVTTRSNLTQSKPIKISTATTPRKLSAITILQVGETWVLISWEAGLGATESFQVTLDGHVVILAMNNTEPMYNQTTLRPSTLNYVTISAMTGSDISQPYGIYIKTRPKPPNEVEITNVTETSFHVMWEPPHSSWDRFIVQLYKATNDTRFYEFVQDGDEHIVIETAIKMNDLLPGETYKIFVKSQYNGTSSYDIARNITLHPNMPRNLTVTGTTANEIALSWHHPVGSFGGYQVEWEPLIGKIEIRDEAATLTGLTPGLNYFIALYSLSRDNTSLSRSFAKVYISSNESPPSPPDELNLTSHGNTSIYASWKPPVHPNGRIINYVVQYQQLFPHPNIDYKTLIVKSDQHELLLLDLEPGAGYYIRIAAQNSAGIGSFTKRRLSKPFEAIPGHVDKLRAIARSSSSIAVSWQPPKLPNGEITLYLLTVTDSFDNFIEEFEFFKKPNSNPFSCLLDNASSGVVSALLYLHIGDPDLQSHRITNVASIPATSTSTTKSPDLEALSEILHSVTSSMREHSNVTFNENLSDGNESHEENYQRNRRSILVDTNLVNGEFEPYCPVRFEVIGLDPYTNYIVSVRVWTSVGEGKMANISVITKQEPPGGSPTSIHASRTNARNMTITWSPPPSPNGPLTYTFVLIARNESDERILTRKETNVEIVDLQPHTSYAISIRASSQVGDGPWSSYLVVHTAQDAPESVQSLTATAHNSRSVFLSWLPPLQPHGVITAYYIKVYDATNNMLVRNETVHVVEPTPAKSERKMFLLSDTLVSSSINESTSDAAFPPPLSSSLRQEILGNIVRDYSRNITVKVISELSPYTNYSFEVSASTQVGESEVVVAHARTLEDTPGSPPINLTYKNITSTSVNITWQKPLEPNGLITGYTVGISSGDMFKLETETEFIEVKNLRKYFPYEVYVWPWTDVGEGPSSTKMIVHTDEDIPASPPRDVSYKNITSTVIEVSWLPPIVTNGLIQHYTIYYSDNKNDYQQESNTTSIILEDLQSYGSYKISVSSSTIVGESINRSVSIMARTMEGQPATPPYNLSYVNLTSSSVKMTWKRPKSPNGIIQFYEVNLWQNHTRSEIRTFRTLDESAMLIMTSLQPFTSYTAVVRASTKYGDGEQESTLLNIWTMEAAPETSPQEASYVNVTSSSIRMNWSPPSVPNGIIVKYLIRYKPVEEESTNEIREVPGNSNEITVTGLKKYTNYNFDISAATIAGEGPGKSISVLTDEDEPSSPPYDVIYKQLTSTSILLVWKPPIHPNGIIVKYRVVYRNHTIVQEVESRDPNVTLTNLQKFGDYDAFVLAHTRVGYGSQLSETIAFRTLQDAPSDPPHNLSVLALTSTSVNASWKPPTTPNGFIQFYTIYYQADNSHTVESLRVRNKTSSLISNLKKYEWYSIWVTVNTALGDGGLMSDIIRERTLEDVPGQPILLNCTVVNENELLIRWSPPLENNGKLEEYIVSIEKRNDENNTLKFVKLDDYDEIRNNSQQKVYVFRATHLEPFTRYIMKVAAITKVGTGLFTACQTATMESVPSAPRDLVVVNKTSTSVTLNWKLPLKPNGKILGYNITYMNRNEGKLYYSTHAASSTGSDVYTVISNLLKYTDYLVSLKAFTSAGLGLVSEIVHLRTGYGIPDSPVSELVAIANNSTSVYVKWRSPRPVTGPTYFIVTLLNAKSSVTEQSQLDTVVVTNEETFITRLKPFTSYYVTVVPKVYDVEGDGPHSTVIVTTQQDRPSTGVDNLKYVNVTSTYVQLTWDPPVMPNGVITGYNVSMPSAGMYQYLPGDVTHAHVTGLSKYTVYDAVVSCRTKVGYGPETRISFMTLQDVPTDSPRFVNIQNVSATDVYVSWEPPLIPNGIISYYKLQYHKLAEQSLNDKIIVVDHPQTSTWISNLNSYTTYAIKVFASSEAGMGPLSSNITTFTTKEGFPSSPVNLHCFALNDQSVLVTWAAPRHINGILQGYIIKHTMQDNGGSSSALHSLTPNYTVNELEAFTTYNVSVEAKSGAGIGSSSSCGVTTLEGYPSEPEGLVVVRTTDREVDVEWHPPTITNGIIRSYVLVYIPPDGCHENGGITKPDNYDQCFVDVGISLFGGLSHLNKFTVYDISVMAVTGKGSGQLTSPHIKQRTAVGEPEHPPNNVHAVALSSTSINITWSKPTIFAGETTYRVTCTSTITMKMTESDRLGTETRSYVMRGLDEDSTYNVTVTAMTSAGSLSSKPVVVHTHEDVPSDSPNDIRVEVNDGNSSSVRVLFHSPLQPNGEITSYTIEYMLKDSQNIITLDIPNQQLPKPTSLSHTWYISGLLGGRAYTVRMQAATKVGPGPWSLWSKPVLLPVTAPPAPDVQPGTLQRTSDDGRTSYETTSTTITVQNPCVFSDVNGPLASISVIVAEDGADTESEPTNWYESFQQNPSPPYKVVAIFDPKTDCPSQNNGKTRRRRSLTGNGRGFVIGKDTTCEETRNEFCNGPLKPNTAYRMKYRAETHNGAITDTIYSEPLRTEPTFLMANLTLIIGVAAALLILILVLAISVIVIRKRRNNRFHKSPESDLSPSAASRSPVRTNIQEMKVDENVHFVESSVHANMAFVDSSPHDKVAEVSVSRPIQKMEFGSHIARLCLNKNKGFSDEFDDIRGLPIAGTTIAADKQCNRTKNRHAKLVPFDQSRVKLECIPSIDGSDYINASFIPGQHSINQFIAAQAPLDHTKRDFWRMLWESGACTIAMLCSAQEGKKRCDEYWPGKQIEYFGAFAVQMTQEDVQAEWTIRRFAITMRDKMRHVTQFHLTKWPFPETAGGAQTVLRFVQTVRANRNSESQPNIVMCSSGSGRSAVFICLDRLLDNLSLKSHVDVFGTVAAVRHYRPYMVQTLGEYILIHRCVYEAINYKITTRRPTGDGMEETVF